MVQPGQNPPQFGFRLTEFRDALRHFVRREPIETTQAGTPKNDAIIA